MITKEELERRMAAGESMRAIAAELGIAHQTLGYHRRRWGLPPLRKYPTSGPAHASWRGGRFTDRFGYTQVLAPENGRANKYVPEHILVAEQAIGRRLAKGEVVHHVNGHRDDNRPENLLVLTRRAHNMLHSELEAIAFEMLTEGVIVFDGSHYRRCRPRHVW